MASHYSTIGLPVKSRDEMAALARRVADDCVTLDCPQGWYLRWSSPCGAELWLQVDADNDLVGMHPHFSGESVFRVGLTNRVTRPDATALDGAFHGWATPAGDDPECGNYPFVFDAPDFLLHHQLQLPAIVKAQVAAFAYEVSLYSSPEAYEASLPPAGPSADNPELLVPARGFASKSFIPSGLFSPGGETTDPPEARAIFTGHIVKTELRRNELTGREFWWALVETYGGILDVVIDPELVAGSPTVGGVLQGVFWLSGRLLGGQEAAIPEEEASGVTSAQDPPEVSRLTPHSESDDEVISDGGGGKQLLGSALFVLGIALLIGNVTGIFPTFPLAGFIVMSIGGAICGAGKRKGAASARGSLGVRYRDGQGVVQDYAAAVVSYRKAAEQGNALAQTHLGYCYESGKGVAQDYAAAVKWYRKAAEQGNALAQTNLGYCYESGKGVAKDYAEAVKWFRKAADQNEDGGQYNLGVCYRDGHGVVQDYAEAVAWFRKAAEQGFARAQNNLGYCHAKGHGVAQNLNKAAEWYRKAAEQGNASAQNRLGYCYEKGQGVAQDLNKAVKWYRKAADQNDACGQHNLGVCYRDGQGIVQDYAEAVAWFCKAAEQGNADAQANLGYCYANGHGVAQDLKKAAEWYRKAADQGNAFAQNGLASLDPRHC